MTLHLETDLTEHAGARFDASVRRFVLGSRRFEHRAIPPAPDRVNGGRRRADARLRQRSVAPVPVELVDVEVRGRRIPAVRVGGRDDLPAAVERLGLERSPVVVLVGGAAHMAASDAARVKEAFAVGIVPVVERLGATVVDGATRVGVMRLIGDVRTEAGAGFPLVGVVAAKLLADAELDERHTHFVLVPGEKWGDESALLSASATVVGGPRAVTVLANGGAIAWDDVSFSVAEGRRVVVLAGSGRTADELAAAKTPRAWALHDSGLVRVVPVRDTDAVSAEVAQALARHVGDAGGFCSDTN
jgi:hypothetical protein